MEPRVTHWARDQVLADYATHLEASGLSAGTIKSYVADLRDFASWLERSGRGSALSAKEDDIRDYCQDLIVTKQHPSATVNRRLQAMRKFYKYALDAALIDEDPSSQIKLLPQARPDGRKGLEREEISDLLEAVRQGGSRLAKRDYAVVQLMLHTGIRVGELTRLKLSDLEWSGDKAFLRVRAEGTSRERKIPLNSSVRKALRLYLGENDRSAGDHLFLSIKGEPLSARSVQRLVNGYAEAAGLKDVSTYTLRQTCGQRLLKDTGDLSLVARLMGHKRLEGAIRYILPGHEDPSEVAEESSLNIY